MCFTYDVLLKSYIIGHCTYEEKGAELLNVFPKTKLLISSEGQI